jgi:cyclase
MLTKRIIPCLDVKGGRVVKGVQFRDHEDVGEIIELAQRYRDAGADELVFYDISASSEERVVSTNWVGLVAKVIDIPFCVAGGIGSVGDAEQILAAGADKVSVNSPALSDPGLVNRLAERFGRQCVVVGVDSRLEEGDYWVYQFTGDESRTVATRRRTLEWIAEVCDRGAGEVVLNCMNQDGVRSGYDLAQLRAARAVCPVPLIASGGAGAIEHFSEVFDRAGVDGALAASVFHRGVLTLGSVKGHLKESGIAVRI